MKKYRIEGRGPYTVEVIDPVKDYLQMMKQIFEFDDLKRLISVSAATEKVVLVSPFSGGTYTFLFVVFQCPTLSAGLRHWSPWRTEKKFGPSQILNYKKYIFHFKILSYKDGRLLRKYNKIVLTILSIANNSKGSLSAFS